MADFLHTIGAKIAAVISGVVLLLTGAVSGNINVPHSGSSESQAAGAAVAVAGTNQLAQTQPGAAGNATSQDATTTVVNYITQPVVERVVENEPIAADNFVTQDQLNAQLLQLSNSLTQKFNAPQPSSLPEYVAADGNASNPYAAENAINNLSNVTITNPTFSGVTTSNVPEGSNLYYTDARVDALLASSASTTFGNGINLSSGCFAVNGSCISGGGGGGASLSAANTWTALQFFSAGASTTNFSNFGTAYFGGTATTSIDNGGNLTVAGNTSLQNATATSFFATNASITNATSTNLFATLGNFTTGIINALSGTTLTYTAASTTGLVALNATTTNATSTNLYVSGTFGAVTASTTNLTVSGNSTLANASSTNFFASTASSTNLFAQTASLGALSAGTLALTSALPIASGGTGMSTAPSDGQVLVGNSSGGYSLVATSSLGISGGGAATWGSIVGTLSNQSDLQNALNAKFALSDWYATTTDALKEGSTNLYFTNARAQNAISVAGAPLTYASGVIGINQANGSTNGYLASTDWTAFNNKIASSSLSGGSGISYNSSTGVIANTGLTSNTGDWAGTFAGQSAAYYLANSFSTTSASYFLAQNQAAAFATSSAQYFLAQNQGFAFSTTSVAYWQSQTNFFSTTSASYFLNQNQTAAFATSSASYFLAQNQSAAFSTTSASYFLSQNQTSSSTPTIGFLTATTTSATSTFAGGLAAGVSGLVYNWATGFTGVGTANPSRLFNVFGASANPQVRISYSSAAYTELQTDAAGDFLMAPTSGIVEVSNGNLEVCSSSVCATPTVAISGNGNFTVENRLVAGDIQETCPSGYIWVPGDDKYGTLPGFCTMQYVASQSGSTPVSAPGGTPWVSITQTAAIADCDAIGPGYHLMTDQEWMTIADETTALPINDLTGSQQFGTGASDSYASAGLTAGDAGANPVVSGCNWEEPLSNSANAYVASSCEERGTGSAGTSDSNKGYWGTGSTFSGSYSAGAAGPSQLRTKILPDGAVIWDIGGNVWQWTDAYEYGSTEGPTPNNAWTDYSAVTNYQGLNIRPDISTWNAASNGIGQIYSSNSASVLAFIRGGVWGNGSIDGPFALYLNAAPSASGTIIGFRCSFSAP